MREGGTVIKYMILFRSSHATATGAKEQPTSCFSPNARIYIVSIIHTIRVVGCGHKRWSSVDDAFDAEAFVDECGRQLIVLSYLLDGLYSEFKDEESVAAVGLLQ